MNIFGILKDKGFDVVPESFYEHIKTWRSWYDGDVKKFHDYYVKTGKNRVKCRRYSMGMGKKVSEDWANLLLNEKVAITLEGEKEQAFIDEVLKENNFAVKANEMQEMKAALGTAAYIPRVVGASVTESGALTGRAEAIKLDYCTAENIFPLSWENGTVTECAFAARIARRDDKYIYLQTHHLEGGLYVIEHDMYKDVNGELTAVPMATVTGFENIPARVSTNSNKPQFVIDRLNIANNIDVTLPLGIAAFANAIDQLKGVDVAYDSYVNEFTLGKKRIMAKPEAVRWEGAYGDGEPVFDENDVVFYVLPEDGANGSIIQPIDMSLRIAEHSAGIQDMLNVLSAKCGFGERHYRFEGGSVATATQIISENSTLFRTLKKHEIILEGVLVELCRILLRLGNTYMGAGLREDVEISIDFDDSIIEDKDKDFARDMQMMSAGVLNAWEFRAKWMNEDEETAKAALPGMEDMTDEGQNEIE